MTVNELVAHIADELNQTSPEAMSRITRQLNKRYRQVTASINLVPTRRTELSKAATIGNRFITFTGCEKLDVVFRKVGTKNIKLTKVSNDEMLEISVQDEPPTRYSEFSVTGTTITLWLDCTPTTTFTLYAHGLTSALTLTGTDTPAIPESFQDILIYGVCADEYRKKEKLDLYKEADQSFRERMSDLRLFLAKNGSQDLYTGKLAPSEGWWDTGSN